MLNDEQKERLDRAADARLLQESTLLKEIFKSYRERSLEALAVPFQSEELDREAAREIRVAHALQEHINSEIERYIRDVDEVAAEIGIDLEELRSRRVIFSE